MNPIEQLTDQQLLNLFQSPNGLDKELMEEIIAEMKHRNLSLVSAQNPSVEEGLSVEQKFFYLFPLFGLNIIFAAKYLGRGEKRKYRDAWRMILLGQVLFFGIVILCYVLNMD